MGTAVAHGLPQAIYPCGNFSDTSSLKLLRTNKGLIGHVFTVCIHIENQNQVCMQAVAS